MSFNMKALLIGVAIATVLAAVVGGAVRAVNDAYDAMEDFYAITQTQVMLVECVHDNAGEWPSSWDELRPYFVRHKNLGWSEDIESLSQLVEIDFNFSPSEYFDSGSDSPSEEQKLVRLTSYRNNNGWEELKEVNRRLMTMLRHLHVDNRKPNP